MSDELSSKPTDAYMLGEMHATIRSIDNNVSAMRTEFSDLTRRLTALEIDMAEIKTERNAMLPEQLAFIGKTRAFMQETEAWKSRIEGGALVAKSGGKFVQGIIAAVLTIILFVIGNIWMDQRSSQPNHNVVPLSAQ